jgi:integrase/recombinase XerD
MSTVCFPALLQGFFTNRLLRQRRASSHTIAAYRDTFRLLIKFALLRKGTAPTQLRIEDLDPPFIGEFLEHLEGERHNSVRTRNLRLAAIRSFFRYVALSEPAHALLCQQILAIPAKRYERIPVAFLSQKEIQALLDAASPTTKIGRRDRALLLVAAQTGLRVSELIQLRGQDVVLGAGAHLRCQGKGRKERCTPLRKDAVSMLTSWLRERDGGPDDPVFATVRGRPLSRDAVERLVAKYAAQASTACPSLKKKHVTPHVLRHSAAMDLLQHGVDRSVIALWLGHESMETTEIYLHADLEMKEAALSRTAPFGVKPGRYRPSDDVLEYLESL